SGKPENRRSRARFSELNPCPTGLCAGLYWKEMTTSPAKAAGEQLRLLSVVIPAHNEEGCVAGTIEHLYTEFQLHGIPHEIVVVDDGSTDSTWNVLQNESSRIPTLRAVQNNGLHGFGRAVIYGINHAQGDAVVI